MAHRASFWEYDSRTQKASCYLCPHFCHISEGKTGFCRTRKNIGNELFALNYGRVSSVALDPIEKKPLYHYKPGSQILSLGTFGCNMRCSFCQNYAISQQEARTELLSPDDILDLIAEVKPNIGIAFTYNEPLMWYELIYDTAKKIKEKDPLLSIILVTNGYINPEPLKQLLPWIDAMNIDLKTFHDSTYRRLCKGTLEPVLETIKISRQSCHLEVTTLMITGENDSEEEITSIARFLAGIDNNIPLHLSRYFPNYQMDKEATDISKIIKAKEIAGKYLNYVYVGNISGIDSSTYCPECHELLIERHYYRTKQHLKTNQRPKCRMKIPVILQ